VKDCGFVAIIVARRKWICLAELADYEQLLGEQDPDLYNWVTRQDTPPAEKQTAVLALFLQHQLVKTA